MIHFSLRQLEYFRSAAETGSFAGAAAELRVSATAVGAAIDELERSLGSQLCVRRRAQGITLTPTGSWLLDEARRLLTSAEELQRGVGDRPGPLRGPIAIGCYTTMAPTVIPELAAGFGGGHPGVRFSFTDGSTDALLEQLHAGRLDAVITYRLGLPDGLEEAVLFETTVNAVLAASHPLSSQPGVSLQSLAHEPLIMLDLAPGNRHNLDILHAAGVKPRVIHRSSNIEVVRSLVARGLGYSLLVHQPHGERSYEGLPVRSLPVHPDPVVVEAVLVWPTGQRLNARTRAVIDYARRAFPPRPGTSTVR